MQDFNYYYIGIKYKNLRSCSYIFYTSNCIIGIGNIKYIRFNLSELLSITDSINSNIYYLSVIIKIFNFLYNILSLAHFFFFNLVIFIFIK